MQLLYVFHCTTGKTRFAAKNFYKHLKAVRIHYSVRNFLFHLGKTKVCSIDESYNCMIKVSRTFISYGAANKCDCPLQCYLPSYPFSVSTSPLSQHFLNHMSQRSQFNGRNLTMTQLRDGLVYLDISYSDLNYVDIQTTPAYDFLAMVSDCSGASGLILGGTLLTIAEILQFLAQLLNELLTSARFARMQRRTF